MDSDGREALLRRILKHNFNRMKNAAQEVKKPMTVEEYIQYELTAECRHEYINGQLFERPDEKDGNEKWPLR